MAVENDADRAIFLDEGDFGAVVTWNGPGGVASFSAIFDSAYQLLADPFLEEGQSGTVPRLVCRTSDVPAGGGKGDAIVVAGVGSYRVVEMMPDGTGMTEVRLHVVGG